MTRDEAQRRVFTAIADTLEGFGVREILSLIAFEPADRDALDEAFRAVVSELRSRCREPFAFKYEDVVLDLQDGGDGYLPPGVVLDLGASEPPTKGKIQQHGTSQFFQETGEQEKCPHCKGLRNEEIKIGAGVNSLRYVNCDGVRYYLGWKKCPYCGTRSGRDRKQRCTACNKVH